MPVCSISKSAFDVSALEQSLRDKLGAPAPDKRPVYRFRELGAFWHHFALYERHCDATRKTLITPFGPDCPYPVWDKEHWMAHAEPPAAVFDPSRPFFEQAWDLFRSCPIPHSVGVGNENCLYTDDWWYSKDCYLCHSGLKYQNASYCYRVVECRDSQFCVFSFGSELCSDLVYSYDCYNVQYGLYSR